MTQTDIKRVLAYSTLSQLGYMFAALGIGAFTAAIFHLMTHGFFKGLLFLGSGSVIHAVHEEQDMRRMGGLSKKIRITYITMLIGSIAIAGIPPLAGFFSKDEILGEAWKLGFQWVWAIGWVVAGLTAFYMFRLMGLTFWGDFRGPKAVWDKIHESPRVMTIPLILLAIPSIFLGLYLGLPLGASTISHWLEPVFAESAVILGHHEAEYTLFGIDGVLILTSVGIASFGIAIAWRLFGTDIARAASAGPSGTGPRTHGQGCRSSIARRSTSGGSTNSTTCCSWSSADGSPTRCGGSTATWSTGPSTASAARPSRRVAACARSRPGVSRTTPWASPSGSS